MKTTHTKGEWKVEQENWPYGFTISNEEKNICRIKPMCYSTSDDTKEKTQSRPENLDMEANAKLIAAAPEMLKA